MPPQKILIIKLSSLGDICHTSLLLSALKRTNPRVEITWVVETRFKPVIEMFDQVDHIISFDLRKPIRHLWNHLNSLGQLRKKKYDLVIDLQGLFKSGIITCLSRSNRRIGFSPPTSREWSHRFYREKFPQQLCNTTLNIAKKNLLLFRWLGFKGELDYPTLNYPCETRINTWIDQQDKWPSDQLKVGVNPWASFSTKQLPDKVLVELTDKIKHHFQVTPILIFGPENQRQARQLAQRYQLILAPETDLKELFSLLRKLDFYIGTDSGPSYISQLTRTKGVVLFGPTNRERQLPSLTTDSSHWFKGIYSSYHCPIIHPTPIRKAYRCLKKNCLNEQCMKQFQAQTVIDLMKQCLTPSSLSSIPTN